MSLVSAISTMDRIVVTADGMAVDTETAEVTNVPKIFKLADNCVAAITGMELEKPGQFMESVALDIKNNKVTGIDGIVTRLDGLIKTRTWAANDKAFLYIMVAGYRNNDPIIRLFIHGGLDKGAVRMYALGNWDKASGFLYDELGDNPPETIEFRKAEQVAIRTLVKGEMAEPESIGGQAMMWHVFPDRIEEKSIGYTTRLSKKHGKGVRD